MREGKSANSDIWKILNRKTIYDSPPYLRLEKQTVELPDGRVIDDYHRLQMPPSSIIFPTTEDGRVVLLCGYRHGIGHTTFFLPGGIIEVDEIPIDAAKRELLKKPGTRQMFGRFLEVSHLTVIMVVVRCIYSNVLWHEKRTRSVQMI